MFRLCCVCLLLIVVFSPLAGAGDPPQLSPEPIDPLELADQELMQSVRKQVEALPPAEQIRKGQQILLDNVEKFQSERIRRRVYLSIGQIYKDTGDSDNALIYLEKAGGSEDGTGVGGVSRDFFLDILQEKGDHNAMRDKALEFRDDPDGSDQDFASLTKRAGVAMIQLGDCDQAVDLGISAATRRPCQATFEALETLASISDMGPGKRQPFLKGMHWLASERTGDFGKSQRFMGNLAVIEEFCDNFRESVEIRKQIVEMYPNTPDTASHILSLASISRRLGDIETAKTYLSKLVEGDYPEEYRQMGRTNLDGLLTQYAGVPAPQSPQTPAHRSPLLVWLMNIFVAIGAIGYMWARRRNRVPTVRR